jgi:4-methylaminobutanoate oxidase (formaldehyde-forming)
MRSKSNLTRLMQYSAQLCATIGDEVGHDIGWRRVGSLRLAASEARWLELKRAATAAKANGLALDLVGPDDVARLFPLAGIAGLRGATWIESDGHVDPYSLTHAYAKGARAGGARIVEGVCVEGFEIVAGRIARVRTDQGAVACETVVNAAGLWARQVGEMAGIELPVTVVEHQYLVTEKSPRVPDALPTLRDPDANFYLKPEPGALAVGGWERATICVNGDGKLPLSFGQELFPDNHDRLSEIVEPAAARVPLLGELGLRTVVNGPIPISADGEPVMGKAETPANLFVACGFTSGIAASGGAGRAMANWIVHGDPGMDLWPFDLRRFGRPHQGLGYLAEAAVEAYAKYYAVAWPDEERHAARPLRRSALHERLAGAGAAFGQKFGFERPNYFLAPGETPPPVETFARDALHAVLAREHRAVRENVALIDMSSFSKFEVSGPGALGHLQWLAAGDVDRPVGAVVYTQLLNVRGGIEADLTVMRLAADRFYVVTGSGFGVRDGEWLRAQAPASVRVADVGSAWGVIHVCGPHARAVLAAATQDDLSNAGFPYLRCRWIRLGHAPALAARLSYTGELGWELHIPTDYMAHAYDRLKEAGAPWGIADVGYRVLGGLRMEKRYVYWSADVTPDDTPLEAGLGFAVAFRKGDFQGRAALLAQKESGLTRRLACFALDDPLPVFGGEAMIVDGRAIGTTTSGDFGHSVGRALVLGYVPAAHADRETIGIEAFGRVSLARKLHGCAYDPSHGRLRD